MKIYFLALIGTALSLFACNSSTNEKTATKTETAEKGDLTAVDSLAPARENCYMRLEGVIAGKPATMHLMKAGKVLEVNYFYHSDGIPITAMFRQPEGDTLLDIAEFRSFERDPDAREYRWSGKLYAHAIIGEFLNSDGSKSETKLYEKYPDGSLQMDVLYLADSVAFRDTLAKSPKAHAMEFFVHPKDNSESWITNDLKRVYAGDRMDTTLSLQDLAKRINQQFFNDYKKEEPLEDEDITKIAYMNHESSDIISTVFNEKDYLVAEHLGYVFLGGAHGMHASRFTCYDRQKKKVMKLEDVVQMDTTALDKLVEKSFRTQFRLAPTEPLSKVLFEDKIGANENFGFTNKGIFFSYAPYEISSYATGQVNIFIPFAELANNLNPAFKKGMGL